MLMMTVTVTMAFRRIALHCSESSQSVTFARSPPLSPFQSSLHLSGPVAVVGRCAFEHLFAVPYSGLVAGSIPGGLVSTALEAIHGVMLFI